MSDSNQTTNITPNDEWGPLSGLPGNPIMWVLIASELVVFGAIFVGFEILRINEPEVFLQSQNHLERLPAAINTMVLITSGFCAAMAVHYQSDNNTGKTRLWLLAAALLGVVFLVVKFMEYSEKWAVGISIDTNDFYMLYFLSTGFHAMHVIFGIVILFVVGWKNSVENVVTGTAFWHMVDLIWVILFPIAYLVR
ncbi:MAG TPA: cytochrome c oxidase subunit 3 family protein [Rhizobiales bacterium]|nr:cytochrome c oxidase subunit 3 family protein [Hyphomicrobiales bacterium]